MATQTRANRQQDAELDEMLNDGPQDIEKDPFAEDFDADGDQEFQFDFSQTGDIKDGTYHAKVQEFLQTTSQAGNPMYSVKFYMPEIGRSLERILSLVPQALWNTGAVLRALGLKPGPDGKMGSFKKSDVVGKLCRVQIVNEAFEGRMIPKITTVSPPDASTEAAFEAL